MSIYFAEDGNYGSADNIVIIDEGELSEEVLEYVLNASDSYRLTIVTQLINGVDFNYIKRKYGE